MVWSTVAACVLAAAALVLALRRAWAARRQEARLRRDMLRCAEEMMALSDGLKRLALSASKETPIEDPVLRCGTVWKDGKMVGVSGCQNRADEFWMTDWGTVYCRCRFHLGNWMVENGRSATREEAEDLIRVQQVMIS